MHINERYEHNRRNIKKQNTDFNNKYKYIIRELKAFEMMLLDTDIITNNIVEVDYLGKDIKDSF